MARPGAVDRFLHGRLLEQLAELRGGALEITDATGTTCIGTAAGGAPPIGIQVEDPRFYRAVAASGSVGAAEAYRDGLWRCDDLVGLVRLLVRNRELLDGMEMGLARAAGLAMRMVP
jgi:cyclopropane-fatty-acyl-phospholipid synthase